MALLLEGSAIAEMPSDFAVMQEQSRAGRLERLELRSGIEIELQSLATARLKRLTASSRYISSP